MGRCSLVPNLFHSEVVFKGFTRVSYFNLKSLYIEPYTGGVTKLNITMRRTVGVV